jgi:glutathione S-transferase
MKLLWSSRSPFVRKVMVTVHELGLAQRMTTERVLVSAAAPNAEVMAVNPLNKIPTLLLDDGSALYDSRVICEYLDTLHGGQKLFPVPLTERWHALRRQALGDGLMDVIVLRLGEQNRPEEQRSDKHLAAFRLKIATTLDRVEREAGDLAGAVTIGHIAIACALGHLDFRFAADAWRNGRPSLAAWYDAFSQRPSMQATQYVEVY